MQDKKVSQVIPQITLNNAIQMPQIGLGVFETKEGLEVEAAVSTALEAGYRLFDTAAIYGNEHGVGKAIKDSGLPRQDMFITTKLWNPDHAYQHALDAFEKSLDKLNTSYLDLYLIHFPVPREAKFLEAWQALETLYINGRVRAIGVANFLPHHLQQILGIANVVPAVNQIELHPMLQQHETQQYCAKHGIAIESYSPLMRAGQGNAMSHPSIVRLSKKHDKSPAQIILRWHIQTGFIVIPKSIHADRIQENIDVFNFELSDQDLQLIGKMNQNKRIGVDPDTFNYIG